MSGETTITAQGRTECIEGDCTKPPVGRGMCRRHYAAWHSKTPIAERPKAAHLKRKTPAERFAEKVDQRGPDECWPWKKFKHRSGHGEFYVSPERGKVPAQTYALELATGERCPPGKEGCHHCDNPPCCNPAHLYYGTRKQNVADMWSRGRRELRPIDPEQVRDLYRAGVGARRIASLLGVGLPRLYRVLEEIGLNRRPAGRIKKAA